MATTQTTQTTEPEITNYELFIFALSVLSLINLVALLLPLDPVVHNVILIMDIVYSGIFLADFSARLLRARNKRIYFVRQGGWLDLVGSFPGLRIVRVFRIIRVGRSARRVGLRQLWQRYVQQRALSALLTTFLAGIILLQYASILVLMAERGVPHANIKTASDAVWWAYVTITTVGYGDRYPVTNTGRIVGIMLMTLGGGLFGVFTGFLANTFVRPIREPKPDTSPQAPEEPAPGPSTPAPTPETTQPDARPAAPPPPLDLAARVDRLAEQLSTLGQELQQLTHLLREQQGRLPRAEP